MVVPLNSSAQRRFGSRGTSEELLDDSEFDDALFAEELLTVSELLIGSIFELLAISELLVISFSLAPFTSEEQA